MELDIEGKVIGGTHSIKTVYYHGGNGWDALTNTLSKGGQYDVTYYRGDYPCTFRFGPKSDRSSTYLKLITKYYIDNGEDPGLEEGYAERWQTLEAEEGGYHIRTCKSGETECLYWQDPDGESWDWITLSKTAKTR